MAQATNGAPLAPRAARPTATTTPDEQVACLRDRPLCRRRCQAARPPQVGLTGGRAACRRRRRIAARHTCAVRARGSSHDNSDSDPDSDSDSDSVFRCRCTCRFSFQMQMHMQIQIQFSDSDSDVATHVPAAAPTRGARHSRVVSRLSTRWQRVIRE